MNITDLNGKHVAIVGAYGREGNATKEALETYAPQAKITLRDRKDNAGYLEDLESFDIVIKAPGIPPYQEFDDIKDTLTNATQIFLDSIPREALVIGVTGSKGKSTTASLIHAILKEAGKDALLVGNIGEPAISHIKEVGPETIVVIELSSYQLLQVTRSPHIALITSFFPEHLDYHGSLDAYKESKKAICKYQTVDDAVFYDEGSPDAKDIASTSAGKKSPYSLHDATVTIDETKLIGEHNLRNIAGATAVARSLGVDDSTITSAVKNFIGLPHRLFYIGNEHGTTWIDDAISTTPDSTIAAIETVSPTTLIVGGKDRGLHFEELGKSIDSSSLINVITMGESGPRIEKCIKNININIYSNKTMNEAVAIAKQSKGICLLSPASPSYDMYKSFEAKGDDFAIEIKK
ncbi:UDP-N-acetylmuramoyl-L-alanine--D-glutamate ligase [Candidatus Peregrinibacteria bacterium CG10_big_fil_rev_8_21_14_0_10_42_8]|nr:MAG: UDP-N-acetylmuramoyl-L-alanine--D-glutamate ligase [Candidatus Peregrinibacteria bacterium CG10_big_fil_rev_8_21_14_0_10_42_8]